MISGIEEKVHPEKWIIPDRVRKLSTSIIREILKFSSQPGVISFAGGLPAPELFPLDIMKKVTADVIEKHGAASMQYSLSQGIIQLREVIAERASRLGSPSGPENILITSGSQQGIEMLARAFIDPGDYILTELPTYVGALQAFNFYQARYVTVDMDSEGMLIDQVEERIKTFHPKLIYTVSNFQNPTGITMSLERREQLVELAAAYDIPLVDDNPYGDVRFSGTPLPMLKSLGGDGVVELGTFSKTFAPGLRVAWMNAPADIIKTFEKVKQASDLHTSTFCQFVLYEFISQGHLDTQIERIKKDYMAKRDIMLGALEEHFPEGITWTRPQGGLFLWVELPKHMSAKDLLDKAVELKVAYVYGTPFFPNGGGDNTMRLNFSNASPEGLVEGVKRLGKLFKDNL
ncbi:MAG: PLP-dependent aminotransferase family protein [candidate division Zixibacteria bacterium]|nr:PLP-dependent aminotransferase family protein [candidate division Zixibacteria bacterium]